MTDLYIEYQVQGLGGSPLEYTGVYVAVNPELILPVGAGFDFFIGPLDIPNNTFPTFFDGVEYQAAAAGATFESSANTIWGPGAYTYAGLIRNPVEDFLEVNEKQDTITPAANIAPAAEDANDSFGPTDPIIGADMNDLAAKYNDLADRFNTLLAHLEVQGLQDV